jgi:hypothetical protein
VEDASKAKLEPIAAYLRTVMIDRAMPNGDMVEVGLQFGLKRRRIKAIVTDENIIGVYDQGVIDLVLLTQIRQGDRSVMREIHPRLFNDLAWQVLFG